MEISEIKQIGIVGAGTMGSRLAELFAESGYDVMWYNRSETGMEQGLSQIRENQQTLIRNDVLTQAEAETARARLHPSCNLTNLASVDVISEAIAENLEVKQKLFKSLDEICRPDTIFTTNTSGLSISEIARAVSYPQRSSLANRTSNIPTIT